MAKNYYAVAKGAGKVPNIYTSWDGPCGCKQYVTGIKGGVAYSGFYGLNEAVEYLFLKLNVSADEFRTLIKQIDIPVPENISENIIAMHKDLKEEKTINVVPDKDPYKLHEYYPKGTLIIWVDGSCTEKPTSKVDRPNYSHGLVATIDNKVIYEEAFPGTNESAVSMRQIYGEVMGSMRAMDYAIKHGYKEVVIAFDYKGIELWVQDNQTEKKWHTDKEHTRYYAKYAQDMIDRGLKIHFEKVGGHKGIRWNERADVLAKQALGIL